MLSASLLVGGLCQTVPVELDSAADGNVFDSEFAVQLDLLKILLRDPLEALAITGALLIQITHFNPPVSLRLSDNDQEEIYTSLPPLAH